MFWVYHTDSLDAITKRKPVDPKRNVSNFHLFEIFSHAKNVKYKIRKKLNRKCEGLHSEITENKTSKWAETSSVINRNRSRLRRQGDILK
jgi:hypothetical protein